MDCKFKNMNSEVDTFNWLLLNEKTVSGGLHAQFLITIFTIEFERHLSETRRCVEALSLGLFVQSCALIFALKYSTPMFHSAGKAHVC